MQEWSIVVQWPRNNYFVVEIVGGRETSFVTVVQKLGE